MEIRVHGWFFLYILLCGVMFQVILWPLVRVRLLQYQACGSSVLAHGKIVRHLLTLSCSNTVSHVGVFCSVVNAIEMCKTEEMVDVFQVDE